MKNKLISVLVILTMLISITPAVTFAATLVPVEGFSYDSSNFSELNLEGKTGFSLDSDGNLVMSMQGVRGSGSRVNLGGSGIEGENVQFKMIYRNTASSTAEYYLDYSFVRGGGFFDIYKQRNLSGSLQMSERVINAKNIFTTNYLDTLFYTAIVINMNTVTGEAQYSVWECTSLSQAIEKNDLSDTVRRTFNGSGSSASGADTALTDIILNTAPSAAGTSADIIVYNISLLQLEEDEDVKGFTYDSSNFDSLNLYQKDGFSINEDGNLVMDMKGLKTEGSQLTLGGNGVEGEHILFNIVYQTTNSSGTAEYYTVKPFLKGGGFFDIYKQSKTMGCLEMSTSVIKNSTKLFEAGTTSAPYYNSISVDMNTLTGEATYAFRQTTSLEEAMTNIYPDSLNIESLVTKGVGQSIAGANVPLTDIVLNTSPVVEGNTSQIIVHRVSLNEYNPIEKTSEFNYNSSNFKTLDIVGKEGFSIDGNGNLVMTMQSETNLGSNLVVGGKGLSGKNIRFKIIYTNSDATATAQYYGNNSFLRGGGFFDIYKQGGKIGSLQMNERVIYNGELFNPAYSTTVFYNTLIVDMNTATGEASYSFWQCRSLKQAQSKDDMSDTLRQLYTGTSTAMAGFENELDDFVLNTMPISAGTSTDITVYEISLVNNEGNVNFDDVIISNEADGGARAFVTYSNTTSSDYDFSLIIASYDGFGKLLEVSVNESSATAKTKLGTESASIPKAAGAVKYKAFLWNNTSSAKPLKKTAVKNVEPISALVDFYYPGYTKKAVTFSYDDGIQTSTADPKLVSIFNKYGIKSTFNLVGKFAPTDESDFDAYVKLYSGHEVANHSQNHLKIGNANQVADISAAMEDITGGRDTIKSYFGQKFDSSKWGFVWAYGRPLERGIDFVTELEDEIEKSGAVYIRPVTTTGGFNLPDNWMLWEPTSKDDYMEKYTHDFLNDTTDGLRLLYLWGHSSDLYSEIYGASYADLEKILAILTSDDVNIWSATNMEIYDYVNAVESIIVSEDNKTVFNPSDVDVYAVISGRQTVIPANGSCVIE